VKLYLEPSSKLVLVAMGPALHAYDVANGTEHWVASMPDKIGTVAIDGDHLWVATIDSAASNVGLIDGKITPTAATPTATAKQLRDDGEYDLIPELGSLDLSWDQFAELRVQQSFCPLEDLPIAVERRNDYDGSKQCRNPNGLAFVTRDKGTAVPYMLGYAHDSKAERWRVQLTKAGSLETIDTGFGQPRAEFFGDEAIISFVPSDNNARIRRISLTDGHTVWETTLVRNSIDNIEGISIGRNLVFVTYGEGLRVLSLADGRELATLGGV
jgi:hypothetical protein